VLKLLERAKEFMIKADARILELVLKRPQCLANLVHPQAGIEEHLPLDLPVGLENECSDARGIRIELQRCARHPHRAARYLAPSKRRPHR